MRGPFAVFRNGDGLQAHLPGHFDWHKVGMAVTLAIAASLSTAVGMPDNGGSPLCLRATEAP